MSKVGRGRDCCLFCGTDSNISTRMENDKSRSLHVISILHKLLQIPIWECGKYLDFASSSSSSPPPGTDWLILCTTCSSMVAHGHDLVQQLDQIHNQLGKIQTTLQNQIANPRKKAMTKTKAKIVDQLKRDISRRMGPDNMSRRSSAKRSFSNFSHFSPHQGQGSIDHMNLDVLVEEIKIEHPEINLDYDDDEDTGSVSEMEVEDDQSIHFIESGGDEGDANSEEDQDDEINVRKARKSKISKTTQNTIEQRGKHATKKKRPKTDGESGPENDDLNVPEGRNNSPRRPVKPLKFETSKYAQYFEKISSSEVKPKSSKASTLNKDQVRCTLSVKTRENLNETCSETLTLQEKSYHNLIMHLKRKHEITIDPGPKGAKTRLTNTGGNME